MWGYHLKQRGKWWHYYRAVPKRFRDVDNRSFICFSLKTSDFGEAKAKAAQISYELDQEWDEKLSLRVSMKAQDQAKSYKHAINAQRRYGFNPQPAESFSDKELIARLQSLLNNVTTKPEQKAILGLVEEPQISMMDGYDRFWDHIEDEWSGLSHDQRRVKRNGYLRALANFQKSQGDIPLYELTRQNALEFRKWWIDRVNQEGLKPHTGKKDLNALRRIVTTNFDIDAVRKENPFAGVRMKDDVQATRIPLTNE